MFLFRKGRSLRGDRPLFVISDLVLGVEKRNDLCGHRFTSAD